MRKVDAVVVVLALIAIVLSASSLYYSMSVMDALSGAEGQIGDMQDKINDLWKEVFGQPSPQLPPLQGQILKVGVALPLSGPNAPFGISGKRGVEWAVDEINAAGGILGAFIQLLIEDTGGDPKIGAAAVEKLITVDHCQVIRGAFQSSVTLAIMEVTEKYEVPLVTIGGSADEITQKGYKYIFRICNNSTELSDISVKFLMEYIKPTRVAILHEPTLMGVSYKNAFVNITKALNPGWKIVAIESYPSGTLDFKPILAKIRAEDPQVLALGSYLTDGALIAKQMKEMGWSPIVIGISGAMGELYQFIDLAGEDALYWFSPTEFTPDRQYPNATLLHEMAVKCWNKYQWPMDFQVNSGYLGMYIIKAAIEKCKSLNPKAIRDALATTEFYAPWFGTVKFYSNGHMPAICTIVQIQPAKANEPWQWHGLTFYTVWPSPYNSSMPIIP